MGTESFTSEEKKQYFLSH